MKNWHNYLGVIVVMLLALFGLCRKDFEFTPRIGVLLFSKDTVFLDRVFTNIGSSTYTLKVYNTTNNNILIPEIKLKNESKSKYRLNVDGISENEFSNIPLLAKNSLLVFIETILDISWLESLEFFHTDALQFSDAILKVKL